MSRRHYTPNPAVEIPPLKPVHSLPPRHRHTFLLRIASLSYLLLWIDMVICITMTPFILAFPRESGPRLLWFPVFLLPLALVWLLASLDVRCALCNMRFLIPQHCAKHPQARRLPLLGYTGSSATRALFTSRIRCPYCAMPNRLNGPAKRT